MEWYYARAGQQVGPMADHELKRMITAGQVLADDLAWCEGMPDWQPVRSITQLAGYLPQANPPAVPHSYQRLTAGVLAILLGGLGIHKFYLGMIVPGLILLACSFLTCFFVIPVTSVIGLIEGIIYLTMSDAEFHRTYVVEKRPWF